jgi:hypothetical protein
MHHCLLLLQAWAGHFLLHLLLLLLLHLLLGSHVAPAFCMLLISWSCFVESWQSLAQ